MTTNHAFLEYEGKRVELPHFPDRVWGFHCWPLVIEEYCAKRRIPYQHVDPYWVTTRVNKRQIETFIRDIFGPTNNPASRDIPRWLDNQHQQLEWVRSFLADDLPEGQEARLEGFDY